MVRRVPQCVKMASTCRGDAVSFPGCVRVVVVCASCQQRQVGRSVNPHVAASASFTLRIHDAKSTYFPHIIFSPFPSSTFDRYLLPHLPRFPSSPGLHTQNFPIQSHAPSPQSVSPPFNSVTYIFLLLPSSTPLAPSCSPSAPFSTSSWLLHPCQAFSCSSGHLHYPSLPYGDPRPLLLYDIRLSRTVPSGVPTHPDVQRKHCDLLLRLPPYITLTEELLLLEEEVLLLEEEEEEVLLLEEEVLMQKEVVLLVEEKEEMLVLEKVLLLEMLVQGDEVLLLEVLVQEEVLLLEEEE